MNNKDKMTEAGQRAAVRLAVAALFDRVETATAQSSSPGECALPDFMESYYKDPGCHTHSNAYVYGALDHTGTIVAFALGGSIADRNDVLVPHVKRYLAEYPAYKPDIDAITDSVMSAVITH